MSKPVCKAGRRIREEVGPHGDRGCKLQKQQNGGMLISNMFHLSVKEPALQAGISSTGAHTRKGNLEPKNNLQSPKGDWVKRRSSQNHSPGRTNKVQVIPEPRLVLRWAMPCFLASRIPTAPTVLQAPD